MFYKVISASSKIEDKIKFKVLLGNKLETFDEFIWNLNEGSYFIEFKNINDYKFDEIVDMASEKYREITEAIIK